MRSGCPLNYGLEIFGDKWSLLIIRDLVFFDKHYYSEFLASAEGISTNILADRLLMLEKVKLVRKEKDPQHKQKVIYYLTEKSIDLLPIIWEIWQWAEKYADYLEPEREQVLGSAKQDRRKALQQKIKALKKAHLPRV